MGGRELTRKDFLSVAGAGATGTAVLGASLLASGCGTGRGARPNVILVIVDSLRKDHVGAYGGDWAKTPTLDALARRACASPEPTRTPCPPSRPAGPSTRG